MWIEKLSWTKTDRIRITDERELDDYDLLMPATMRAIIVYLLRKINELENKLDQKEKDK